jgi:hypothetical protein
MFDPILIAQNSTTAGGRAPSQPSLAPGGCRDQHKTRRAGPGA